MTASLARSDPWPPAQMARTSLPMPGLGETVGQGIALATGPPGCVCAASTSALALYDLHSTVALWETHGEDWAGEAASWTVALDPEAASTPASRSGAEGSGGYSANSRSRSLSYSPYWRLLAAVDVGAVALWDVRIAGSRGAAATLRVAGGASWVHLDEAFSTSGHMLVAPCAGGHPACHLHRRPSSAAGSTHTSRTHLYMHAPPLPQEALSSCTTCAV